MGHRQCKHIGKAGVVLKVLAGAGEDWGVGSLDRRRSLFPQPGKGDEAEGETDKHMLLGEGVEGS